MKYYINGKADNSSGSILLDMTGSKEFHLGKGIDATIDQFAVYTQSMQTAEVEKLYASELPRHILADGK